MRIKNTFILITVAILTACNNHDSSVIYKNSSQLEPPDMIKLDKVKVVSDTDDKLIVDLTYTYTDSIPPNEVKLFVMPDHGYWSTRDVKISNGTHTARAIIGLSKGNMDKDHVTESDTTKLRFRFDHYKPHAFLGNIWGVDVPYKKHWKLK